MVIGNVPTLTPAELQKFLNSVSAAELPTLVLLAFCPLRTAEVARLDWKDVRLAERVLIVNASVAKISIRRVIPVPEAACEWLRSMTKEAGPIWPAQPDPYGDRLAHQLPLLAKAAGVPYAKNTLRHSVISALMATEQDAGASRCGQGIVPGWWRRITRRAGHLARGRNGFQYSPARLPVSFIDESKGPWDSIMISEEYGNG